jgi:membrane protease YdiL (CAAX protease family)
MSDPHPPDVPEFPDEAAPESAPSAEEFDLPLSAAPASVLPPRRKPAGVLRALAFFTLAFAIGAGVGQSVGLGVGLALLGERLPAGQPALAQAAMLRFLREPLFVFCMGFFSLLLTLGITALFTRFWEGRPATSVGLQWRSPVPRVPPAPGQFLAGFLLGALLMLAIFAVEVKLGWLKAALVLLPRHVPAHAALWFVALLPAAAAEELMLRGYTFQALEEQWGGAAATLITATVFGAAHAVNPNSGWASFLGIMASGILFGVAFLTTRRLWLPIGLHVSWNLFEGPLLGFPVSGFQFPSALAGTDHGPALWTGGAFGPEAGLLGVLACLLGAGLLLLRRR